MKTATFNPWQAWEGTSHVLLSEESSRELLYFKTWEDLINWLYLNGHKPAARAINSQVKK